MEIPMTDTPSVLGAAGSQWEDGALFRARHRESNASRKPRAKQSQAKLAEETPADRASMRDKTNLRSQPASSASLLSAIT
jgi:hypothetical protein